MTLPDGNFLFAAIALQLFPNETSASGILHDFPRWLHMNKQQTRMKLAETLFSVGMESIHAISQIFSCDIATFWEHGTITMVLGLNYNTDRIIRVVYRCQRQGQWDHYDSYIGLTIDGVTLAQLCNPYNRPIWRQLLKQIVQKINY